jgi:hypothetical protein
MSKWRAVDIREDVLQLPSYAIAIPFCGFPTVAERTNSTRFDVSTNEHMIMEARMPPRQPENIDSWKICRIDLDGLGTGIMSPWSKDRFALSSSSSSRFCSSINLVCAVGAIREFLSGSTNCCVDIADYIPIPWFFMQRCFQSMNKEFANLTQHIDMRRVGYF